MEEEWGRSGGGVQQWSSAGGGEDGGEEEWRRSKGLKHRCYFLTHPLTHVSLTRRHLQHSLAHLLTTDSKHSPTYRPLLKPTLYPTPQTLTRKHTDYSLSVNPKP